MKIRDIENIIFDIDSTMIVHEQQSRGLRIYKRPYLEDFLDFCFQNYKNVALWTHASESWAKMIVGKFLKPRMWSFILTIRSAESHIIRDSPEICRIKGGCDEETYMIKNLNKIWTNPHFSKMGFRSDNTVIIDDTSTNSILNKHNAIICTPYEPPTGNKDYDMFMLALLTIFNSRQLRDMNINNIHKIYMKWWKKELIDK